MHKKSFTFGLGAGILFVTGIFYLMANLMQPEIIFVEMTNEEIRDLAIELGYIVDFDEEIIIDELYESSSESIYDQTYEYENEEYEDYEDYEYEESEPIVQETPVPPTPPTPPAQPVAPQAPTQQVTYISSETYPAISNDYEDINNNEDISEYTNDDSPAVPIIISIPDYAVASEISEILFNNNIIDDPNGFIDFLISQDYADRIQSGLLVFSSDMTYDQVLDSLTY